jgi:hypothetical protein
MVTSWKGRSLTQPTRTSMQMTDAAFVKRHQPSGHLDCGETSERKRWSGTSPRHP